MHALPRMHARVRTRVRKCIMRRHTRTVSYTKHTRKVSIHNAHALCTCWFPIVLPTKWWCNRTPITVPALTTIGPMQWGNKNATVKQQTTFKRYILQKFSEKMCSDRYKHSKKSKHAIPKIIYLFFAYCVDRSTRSVCHIYYHSCNAIWLVYTVKWSQYGILIGRYIHVARYTFFANNIVFANWNE